MTTYEVLCLWANREATTEELNQTISACKQALKDVYLTIGAQRIRQTPTAKNPMGLDRAVLAAMEEKERYRELMDDASDRLAQTLFYVGIVSRALACARPFDRQLLEYRLKNHLSHRETARHFGVSPSSSKRICTRLFRLVEKELETRVLKIK